MSLDYIKERLELVKSIDLVIHDLFEPYQYTDLRRGAVQLIICRYIGKKRSNMMKVLINERMASSSYRPSVWQGYPVYKRVRIKNRTPTQYPSLPAL